MKILVVDDHPMTRAGTIALLRGELPGAVFAEAGRIDEARDLCRQGTWDLLLLDQNLPDGAGISLASEVSGRIPVLLVSMYGNRELGNEAAGAGAKGYLNKSDSPEELLRAVRSVLSGGTHRPPSEDDPSGGRPLSDREREVLLQVVRGRKLSQIAREMGLSPTTVQSYKNRLLEKFGADSTAELIRTAAERGIR